MVAVNHLASDGSNSSYDETLFSLIAQDLEQKGYSVRLGALPELLAQSLLTHQLSIEAEAFKNAGIGRGEKYLQNEFVRTDEICWITEGATPANQWLDWTARLQDYLNRRLFLGLFSFESHFAHYGPGDYYKCHCDAFKGEANRVLSVVAYFNSGWTSADGGELVLYMNEQDKQGLKVVPLLGTLVIFLSEEFPHEVLPAKRDRRSIVGWFRVNTSVANKVDPPV